MPLGGRFATAVGLMHNRGMSPKPPADFPGDAAAFLPGLRAGLDAVGFWEGPAVIGVSGGADSVALLMGIVAVAAERGSFPAMTVAHVVHDLRPSAGSDALFVAALAERVGLPSRVAAVAVRAVAHGSEGLEGRARRLRYQRLLDAARERGAVTVVVAHTADDQAETILHRIVRGTGVAGLAGMSDRRRLGAGVALVRPLLGVSGAAARGYLRSTGQAWCEDESNADRRFARNFLRHEVLPLLTSGPYPAAAESLVRLGRQAAAAAAALAAVAEKLLAAHATKRADGAVEIDAAALASHHPHVIAEVFVTLWRREGWPLRDMTERHYRALTSLLAATAAGERHGDTDYPAAIRVAVTHRSGATVVVVQPPRTK